MVAARDSYRETKAMHSAPAPLTTTSVLRSFRSDVLRDLARRALDQGWDAYPTGGGHLRLVNPANGGMVEMSTSAGGSRYGHDQRNVRVALARAGLDLRPKADRRRDRIAAGRRRAAREHPIEEVPMMTTPAPKAEPTPTPAAKAPSDPFARVPGSQRSLEIDGRKVQTWKAKNGGAWALVGAPDGSSVRQPGNKGFSDRHGDEAEVMRRVREYIASGAVPEHRQRRAGPVDRHQATPEEIASFGHKNGAGGPAVPNVGAGGRRPTAAELPAPVPTAGPDSPAAPTIPPSVAPEAVWASVRVDPADYPIAASLANLARQVGPAIEALEAAGKVDAAALVRAELAQTPAEAELMRLWVEVTERPRLEHRQAERAAATERHRARIGEG